MQRPFTNHATSAQAQVYANPKWPQHTKLIAAHSAHGKDKEATIRGTKNTSRVMIVKAHADARSIPAQHTYASHRALVAIVVSVCLLCLITSSPRAVAQITTAAILGTITDPTGAAIPGATVALTNTATGVTNTTDSNKSGDFIFNLLIPGPYSLSVEAKGFRKAVFSNIVVAAGDRTREDVSLKPGSIAQTVVVSAAPPALQTDSSSLTNVVGEHAVQNLPLDGRNYINLVQLTPGANQGQPASTGSGARPDDRRQTSTVTANGQSDQFNNELLDGMDNNEREQGFIAVRPSIEAIAEVVVDTNDYNAEIGRAAGAVVNIITKSGTDAYHGSLYDYFRNDIFDARDFFARTGVTPKPEYRQNQFGGSIGGPIVKGKTFFFADAEDDRIVQGVSSGLLTVPTLYEEQHPGDFRDIGGPFAPTASLDPVGKAYFEMFPAPNISPTATVNNYTSVGHQPQTAFSLDGRIDQHFTNGDILFGRYSYNNVNTFVPPAFPAVTIDQVKVQPGGTNDDGPSITKAHGFQLSYTHPFSRNLLMELKTGYTRVAIQTLNLNNGSDVSSALGLVNVNIPTLPESSGLMPVTFSTGGYTSLGDSGYLPILDINNAFLYQGSLLYTHGSHNIKAGAQIARRQLNYFISASQLGQVSFLGMSGNSLEDLLLGDPYQYTRQVEFIKPGYRDWEEGYFLQDDWRVNHRLTLNLGLRYDIYTAWTEAHNRYANFDYPSLTLIQGTTDPHIGMDTSYSNFAPRIGFAESLGTGTVVRGGYGISFYPSTIQSMISIANPPYFYSNTCLPCTGVFRWPVLPVPTESSTGNLSGNLTYQPRDFNVSYVHQFNLMVQQQIGANVFSLGGVGELGRDQLFQPTVNLPSPSGPYANDATDGPGPTPAFVTANVLPAVQKIQGDLRSGTSNYYAFQAIFSRRFSHGLGFNANYTWAHGLSDAISSSYVGGDRDGLLPFDPHYDYGNSSIDIRNRIATSVSYVVPFGKNAKGLSGLMGRGWSVNAIVFWQTGLPFTVSDGKANPHGVAQINLPLVTSDRPDVVAGQEYRSKGGSISNWLNVNAFTPQPAGTPGNERAWQIYGPHLRRADLSLQKNFELSREYNLEFRAECYNLSNTPNFSNPAAQITGWTAGPEHTAATPISSVGLLPGDIATNAGGFGSITSTVNNINPRQFQFALRVQF